MKQLLDDRKQLQQALLQQATRTEDNSGRQRSAPPFRKFDAASEEWVEYKLQLFQHFAAYNILGDVQKSYFFSWVGVDILRICIKLFPHTQPETVPFVDLIAALDKHFDSQVLVAAARYKFFRTKRQPTQSYWQ